MRDIIICMMMMMMKTMMVRTARSKHVYNGNIHGATEWARETRINIYTIYSYMRAHWWLHSGFFFSAKAFMPIFWSWLPNRPWKTRRSYSTPSRSARSWLLLTTSLAACTATRE